jgi:hypothetical protein
MNELWKSFLRFNQDRLRLPRITTASVSEHPAQGPILAQGGACGQKARKILPPFRIRVEAVREPPLRRTYMDSRFRGNDGWVGRDWIPTSA